MVADDNTRLLLVAVVPIYHDHIMSTANKARLTQHAAREENAPLLQRHRPLTDGTDPDMFRGHGDERDEAELEPGPALCLNYGDYM